MKFGCRQVRQVQTFLLSDRGAAGGFDALKVALRGGNPILGGRRGLLGRRFVVSECHRRGEHKN